MEDGVGKELSSESPTDFNADLWLVSVFQLVQGALDGAFSGEVIHGSPGLQGESSPEALCEFIFDTFIHIRGVQLELTTDTKAISGDGKVVLTGCAEFGIGQVEDSGKDFLAKFARGRKKRKHERTIK